MRRLPNAAAVCALTACAASPCYADDMTLHSLDGDVRFAASYGLTSLKANEYVYDGKTRLSQLIWQSRYVNTVNGTLTVELPWDWHMEFRGTLGIGGDSHMADFDWQFPGKSAWSDRSLHPDTRLNHYYTASAELGRDLVSLNGTDIGLAIGFKYSDVQWTAWGGSFVYSTQDFRDSRGSFDPRQKDIGYRQSWPTPYVGLNVTHNEGDWTFKTALQGGITVNAADIDNHWARSLRFHDYFETTPTLSISAAADYALSNNNALFVSGAYDRIFPVRGDTRMVDTIGGEKQRYPKGAGASYSATSLAFGVKGKF